jgi:DNA-binding MarR family transcriptional regulator
MRMDFDIDDLDDVIHGRLRLGVMAYLAAADVGSFAELKARLKAADGNLSVQLHKLEAAGYVALERTFRGKRPHMTARLTPKGRDAFRSYISTLSKLVNDGD